MSDQTTRILDDSGVPRSGVAIPASLVLIYGGELGRRFPLDGVVEIGRAASNGVMIEADSVSRAHARLTGSDEGFTVEDLGSTNGTLVNGERIEGIQKLAHGDLLKIGGVVLRYIAGDDLEARYHEEIYRMTIVDGLTQVANRRHFDDFLEREVARCSRFGGALSLILFDVDRFKEVNDQQGHLLGDRLLREVASTVGSQVRREQLLARFGGDEFGIVLPDVALADALAFAEKIRSEIAGYTVSERGRRARVTLSLGVASLEPAMDAAALLRRADESLYASKARGRDRVSALQAGGGPVAVGGGG